MSFENKPPYPEGSEDNCEDTDNESQVKPFISDIKNMSDEELMHQKSLRPYRDDSNSLDLESYKALLGFSDKKDDISPTSNMNKEVDLDR